MSATAALGTGETVLAIVGLAAITLLTRGFFVFTRREMPFPNWLREGLRYAPLAAMAASSVAPLCSSCSYTPGRLSASMVASPAAVASGLPLRVPAW